MYLNQYSTSGPMARLIARESNTRAWQLAMKSVTSALATAIVCTLCNTGSCQAKLYLGNWDHCVHGRYYSQQVLVQGMCNVCPCYQHCKKYSCVEPLYLTSTTINLT